MYSEETNKKKMRDFNRFMNSVLESPLLRSNELVELFMTKNPDEFHVIKLKYKNISKLTSMKDFHSLTGDLDVTHYFNESHSSEKLYNNIEKKRNILKEINTTMKNAINCMDNLNKYLGNLSQLFFDLKTEYQTKDNKFNALDNLGRLFNNISGYYNEKKNLLDFKIREFFKYINLELKEIKNMCNDAKYAKINLEKCENAFNNFKNEMAQTTCNFLRNRAFEEYQRIMDLHHIRIKKYFSEVGANISELLKNEYTFSMQIIQCFNIIYYMIVSLNI